MKNIFLSILLLIVAILLFAILLPVAVVWGIGASFWKRKFKNGTKEVAQWFYAWALSIDQLGNVVCKELFNDALRKPKGAIFGNPDETISSVLGKNKLTNTLTGTGRALDWVLNKLDPNHSINSIEEDE
ncbi:hypothetical protein V2605_03440 [Tenacibaculum maritimum]|uniref:hypothetical protein n=1 Tax=Tenacibaculum maritimum TaxID=107401 RepID=UPI0012E5105C|nr:hypothetical protein [Tenacibaculum maritimum]CAA0254832.1 NUDIX hydrolase [Tenacibaculum maritimum]